MWTSLRSRYWFRKCSSIRVDHSIVIKAIYVQSSESAAAASWRWTAESGYTKARRQLCPLTTASDLRAGADGSTPDIGDAVESNLRLAELLLSVG